MVQFIRVAVVYSDPNECIGKSILAVDIFARQLLLITVIART